MNWKHVATYTVAGLAAYYVWNWYKAKNAAKA